MNKEEKSRKQVRHFSEEFKREKVKYIDEGLMTVGQVSKEYEVSKVAVYKWMFKYSLKYERSERVVIEKESEEVKRKKLASKLAEVERLLGQKQMEIEYLERVIELSSELVGIDLKKKFDTEF